VRSESNEHHLVPAFTIGDPIKSVPPSTTPRNKQSCSRLSKKRQRVSDGTDRRQPSR